MRQYLWLFENSMREGVEDFLILAGKHVLNHPVHMLHWLCNLHGGDMRTFLQSLHEPMACGMSCKDTRCRSPAEAASTAKCCCAQATTFTA